MICLHDSTCNSFASGVLETYFCSLRLAYAHLLISFAAIWATIRDIRGVLLLQRLRLRSNIVVLLNLLLIGNRGFAHLFGMVVSPVSSTISMYCVAQ